MRRALVSTALFSGLSALWLGCAIPSEAESSDSDSSNVESSSAALGREANEPENGRGHGNNRGGNGNGNHGGGGNGHGGGGNHGNDDHGGGGNNHGNDDHGGGGNHGNDDHGGGPGNGGGNGPFGPGNGGNGPFGPGNGGGNGPFGPGNGGNGPFGPGNGGNGPFGPGNGGGNGPGTNPGHGHGNGPGPGNNGPGVRRLPNWRHVAKRGGACKFEDDAAGPADAFVIANGQDVSIVFTQLGSEGRVGPLGLRKWSQCDFEIPIGIESGYYLSGWHETLSYGVVKPANVGAGLGLKAQLGVGPRRIDLPDIDVNLPRASALNVPLATQTAEVADIANRPVYNQWRRQVCTTDRGRDVSFLGTAYTWSQRFRRAEDEVIIAIDGLDTRYDVGATVDACPANP